MSVRFDARVGLNLTEAERKVVDQIATEERRNPTDVLRIIIEDLVSGTITIEDVPDEDTKRTSSGVRVTKVLKQRFDDFRGSRSADVVISKALKKKAARLLDQTNNGEGL